MSAGQSNIIPFAFEDHLVRVYKPNGEPWFVGKDVCEVLDIKNHNDALKRLDDDERGSCSVAAKGVGNADPLCAVGGEQTMVVVSEAGVFRLIFTSRKPEAERFKRFLAHEVLPALRKHGSYSLPGRETAAAQDAAGEFPGSDEALSVHLAKLATLKECRMIHGPRAAARLWKRLGLPQVGDSVIEELDEGRRCLQHLLASPIGDDAEAPTLRWMIEAASDDNFGALRTLREHFGVLLLGPPDEGLFVPNTLILHKPFAGTPWADGRHVAALRRLPGSRPERRSVSGQQRGTFIPLELIETLPQVSAASDTGGKVVPLKS
ncbi:hypothetical protein LOC51_19865 [Rubrivivax sp. JA1024]|nr:hypothetical protein [Rubrivivax sp. JA1024]